jgi:serine O-acetyltransferase
MNPIKKATFISSCRAIRSDYRRLINHGHGSRKLLQRIFWLFSPSFVALFLHRLTHFCYVNHLKFLAWPLYLFNYYLTKVDITPQSVIGEGLFLGHVAGTTIAGRIGNNVTLHSAPGIGGGVEGGDIGGGEGLPVIEDNVIVGGRAAILGPIRIGKGAVIGPYALVMKDVPPGGAMSRPAMISRPKEKGDAPSSAS